MTNAVLKVLKREFYINRKLSLSYLPIYVLIILFFAITGRALESSNKHLLLLLAINLFFPMIYFVNIYLQQSKDKDLPFLSALPINKKDVVAGKIFYIVLVSMLFNGFICLTVLSMTNSLVIYINSLFMNCFIGTLVGMTFLAFFLFSSFENFISFSQYIRIIIVLAFTSVIYIVKLDISDLSSAFTYNPVYPILLYISVIYIFYKFLLIQFRRKKSYV